MPEPLHTLISYLQVTMGACRNDPRSDTELLTHFAKTRDETAFATLIWRHGKLVWRTCKAILRETPDAEDVFQTVFLTLARKADRLSIKSPAGWLHRVARQAALNVRAAAQRRQNFKQKLFDTAQTATKNIDQSEKYALLDEEIAELPEKLRVPLVLRYLEEKTQVEVARILGCSHTAVQKRLTKGEAILRERMERRGVTLGAVSVATLLGNSTRAPAIPARLIESTTRAAVAFRAGALTGASAEAAEKMLRSLSLKGVLRNSWQLVLMGVCSLSVLGAGLAIWKFFPGGSNGENAPATSIVAPMRSDTVHSSGASIHGIDIYGDPLPKGAVARIGTVRFRAPGGSEWDSNVNRWLDPAQWQFSVALSPDGRILASYHQGGWPSRDGKWSIIRFWDVATGKQLHETVLKDTFGTDARITFSPDGKLLAVNSEVHPRIWPGKAETWPKRETWLVDAATGQVSGQPICGGWPLVFTRDGKTLACENLDKRKKRSLKFYDVSTRKQINALEVATIEQKSHLTFATFSRDGRFLAYIEKDGITEPATVHLMEVKTGKELAVLQEPQTIALVFSPDGDNFVTADKDKVIRVRDTKTGKELRRLGTMAEMPALVSFLPDGKTVLATCAGQIRRWDITTGKETHPALDCKRLLSPQILSADGTKLVERIRDTLSIWDATAGKEIDPVADAPRSYMDALAFSPDGRVLATMGRFGGSELQFWDVATGKLLDLAPAISKTSSPFLREPAWPWRELAWPSHNILVAQVFDLNNNPLPRVVRCTKSSARESLVEPEIIYENSKFSSDGRILARLRDKDIEFLDIAIGKKFASIPRHVWDSAWPSRWLGTICFFSVDHQILATQIFREPTITLWEVSTGRKLYSFNLPECSKPDELTNESYCRFDRLTGVSPDGRLVVTQNLATNVISLWEHVSGQLRLHLPPPLKCVRSGVHNDVAFSSDGRLLATGYISESKEERSIYVWDLATGLECQRFQGHKAGYGWGGAPRAVFSTDGRHLASAGMDYTVLIWDIRQPPLGSLNQPLDQKELQILKTALIGADAAAAYRAIGKLCQAPEQAVALAVECLQPQTPTSKSQEVSQLISDLDSDDFQTRLRAAEKLRKRLNEEDGESSVQSMLYEAMLRQKISVEVNEAIAKLLEEQKAEQKWGGARSPEMTRMFRGIEILERVHNDTACKVLQKMVATPPRPEVRQQAEAALKRLASLSPDTLPVRP